jgi:hypothetical protein
VVLVAVVGRTAEPVALEIRQAHLLLREITVETLAMEPVVVGAVLGQTETILRRLMLVVLAVPELHLHLPGFL